MIRASSFIKKAAAVVVTAALLIVTPGIGSWQVFAGVIAPVTVNAPIGGNFGGVGVAGAGIHMPGAGTFTPNIGMPVMGVPGFAPTVVPTPHANTPGLPASAIPGAQAPANTFDRFAQPGPIRAEGAYIPPAGPPGGNAAFVPAAAQFGGAAQTNGGLLPGKFEPTADGMPAQISDSIGSFHGQTNHLGRHFNALRGAFGIRADADLNPVNGVNGGFKPAAGTSYAGAVSNFLYKPISAARTGLAKLIGVGRSESAPLAPPKSISLKTSADGMSLTLEAAAPVNAVSEEAPASAPAPAPAPAPKSSWFGLGKTAMMFIGSLVVAQIGVEALGSAMPTLVQKTFGDFTAVAQLAVFSSIASVIGRQLGPVAVRRFGLKTSYLGASALRLVSISILAGLLATGHMTLPLMMGFYSLNGFLSGISLTAMESIPPALVGQDQARIEKFWTWEQTILETIGIAGPIATGAIVASFGFLPALIAFPVTMAASLAIVALTVRIPKGMTNEKAAVSPKHGFWSKITHGARLVWTNPILRTAFLGYTVYTMLNPFLYTMLGPAYGLALMGAEHAQAATSVIGWLTGLYSLGGLLGGFMMMFEQKRTAKAKLGRRKAYEAEKGAVTDEQWDALSKPWENEILRKSMLKWMAWGTAGLLGVAAMALPVPMLGTLVHLPAALGWLGTLTLPALTLIPFGMAQVVSMLKLRSYFQASVPDAKENMPDAMGFFGSASLAVNTAGILALKYLFKAFTGFTPFYYVALAMVPLGAYYLYLRWRMNRLSTPA